MESDSANYCNSNKHRLYQWSATPLTLNHWNSTCGGSAFPRQKVTNLSASALFSFFIQKILATHLGQVLHDPIKSSTAHKTSCSWSLMLVVNFSMRVSRSLRGEIVTRAEFSKCGSGDWWQCSCCCRFSIQEIMVCFCSIYVGMGSQLLHSYFTTTSHSTTSQLLRS